MCAGKLVKIYVMKSCIFFTKLINTPTEFNEPKRVGSLEYNETHAYNIVRGQ